MNENIMFLSGSRIIDSATTHMFLEFIFKNALHRYQIEKNLPNKIKFKVGNARGYDKYSQMYLEQLVEKHPDLYTFEIFRFSDFRKLYKGGAGKKLNESIINDAQLGIILWDGISKGTFDAIIQAVKLKIDLLIGFYSEHLLEEDESPMGKNFSQFMRLTIHRIDGNKHWLRSLMDEKNKLWVKPMVKSRS